MIHWLWAVVVSEDVGTITYVHARDPEGNLIELQNWRSSDD